MPRDGTVTRTAILDAAEALVLKQGFGDSSVDSIIERAGITKGTFFYHFKSKAELARTLIERYAANDVEHMERNFVRAEKLSRDPLQQVLILIGLYQEEFSELTEPHPGCLFAAYSYESQLFDEEVQELSRVTDLKWRARLGGKLEEVMKLYPPRMPVRADDLAEMITVIFEGGFIQAKIMVEPQLIADQLEHYRNYLELLFSPPNN